MTRIEYSPGTRRLMLWLLAPVLGGMFLGSWLEPERGGIVGAGIGTACFFSRFGADLWNRRRGEAWVRAGRTLGLKSIYSGHLPPILVEGCDEILNVLGRVESDGAYYVGDRTERFLTSHRSRAANQGQEEAVSDPVVVETVVVVFVPGVSFPRETMKSRPSAGILREDDAGLGRRYPGLARWLGIRSGWRIELGGNCLMALRSGRIASIRSLPEWEKSGRTLLEAALTIKRGEEGHE